MTASVLLKLDKSTDGFWVGFLGIVDDKTVRETDTSVVASIPVKSYSLSDHQFISLKVSVNGGKEMVILILRSIVMGIVEGARTKELSGFLSPGKRTQQ